MYSVCLPGPRGGSGWTQTSSGVGRLGNPKSWFPIITELVKICRLFLGTQPYFFIQVLGPPDEGVAWEWLVYGHSVRNSQRLRVICIDILSTTTLLIYFSYMYFLEIFDGPGYFAYLNKKRLTCYPGEEEERDCRVLVGGRGKINESSLSSSLTWFRVVYLRCCQTLYAYYVR